MKHFTMWLIAAFLTLGHVLAAQAEFKKDSPSKCAPGKSELPGGAAEELKCLEKGGGVFCIDGKMWCCSKVPNGEVCRRGAASITQRLDGIRGPGGQAIQKPEPKKLTAPPTREGLKSTVPAAKGEKKTAEPPSLQYNR